MKYETVIRIGAWIAVACAVSGIRSAAAAEIKGHVTAGGGGELVQVKMDSDLLPNPGDSAEIVVEIPGLNEFALVASGIVAEANDQGVAIKVRRAPGKVTPGQLVVIKSDKPRKRSANKSAESPAPGTPPSSAESAIEASPVTYEGHESPLYALAQPAGGNRVFSGGSSGRVVVWDLHGKEIAQYLMDSEVVDGLDFSPDGRLLLSGNTSGEVILRDSMSGQVLRRIPGDATVSSVAFSRDGRRFLAGTGGPVSLIDEPTPQNARDQFLVRLWNTQDGQELRRFAGHKFAITALALANDGKLVASGCKGGRVRVWDIATGQMIRQFKDPMGWAISSIRFTEDSRGVLIAGGEGAEFDPADLELPADNSAIPPGPPPAAELDHVEDRVIRWWDIQSGREVRGFRGHRSPVGQIALTPDGRRLLSAGWDQTVRIWNMQSGREITQFAGHERSVSRVSISGDGRLVLSADHAGVIRSWRLPSDKPTSPVPSTDNNAAGDRARELKILAGHKQGVQALAFSLDGKQALTCAEDLRIWDLDNGQVTGQFAFVDRISSAAFSMDCQYLLTGCDDGMVRLWNASTGDELGRLSGHSTPVLAVAFSRDGRRAATGAGMIELQGASTTNKDCAVKWWDVASGKELKSFAGHQAPVMSVTFSPNGLYIFSTSTDRSMRLWDTRTGNEVVRYLEDEPLGVLGALYAPPDASHFLAFSGGPADVETLPAADPSIVLRHSNASADDPRIVGDADPSGEMDAFRFRLWEIQRGVVVRRFRGHQREVVCAVFSPDGRHILSGSADRTARWWSVESAKELARLAGHEAGISRVAISSDGLRALTADHGGTVRLWGLPQN